MSAVAEMTARTTAVDLPRRLVAEGLGTAMLLAVVVGSGIMGERLSGGNDALALLGNAVATGAALVVLITALGPVSGAHFNPAVTGAFLIQRRIGAPEALAYVGVQVVGAVAGVMLAHLMFAEPALQISTTTRAGPGQALSECVATFGLLLTIFGCLRHRPEATPAMVALYITAGYWFTASTSFANPAVTTARIFTDSFAGIAPGSAPGFWFGQGLGMVAAVVVGGWLFGRDEAR